MDTSDSPSSGPLVRCSTCRKEIPKSTALMPEGSEYVEHFCGTDCYDQYFSEHPEKNPPANDPRGKP
ncbi:DUF3330 domain-containing protein [Ferriphaselus sp. R-1]|uniref:DUF3330 domain-containing protein n=1 Tax=Ferriphaselus sp. R-1 TaxID=1485544 RepID=UPI0009DD7553|nr:DUF3330 domain-containing protein [Ferriphaselus sp. R-1]